MSSKYFCTIVNILFNLGSINILRQFTVNLNGIPISPILINPASAGIITDLKENPITFELALSLSAPSEFSDPVPKK